MLTCTACFWHLHYLPQELSIISICSSSCLGAVTMDFTFPVPHWPCATQHPQNIKGEFALGKVLHKIQFKKKKNHCKAALTTTANLKSFPPPWQSFPKNCWHMNPLHLLMGPQRAVDPVIVLQLNVPVLQRGLKRCQDDSEDQHTSHITKHWIKHISKNFRQQFINY